MYYKTGPHQRKRVVITKDNIEGPEQQESPPILVISCYESTDFKQGMYGQRH